MHSKCRFVFILTSHSKNHSTNINNIRYKKNWIFPKDISKYCNWIEVSWLNIPKFPTYLKSYFHHMPLLCCIMCTHAKITLCLLFFLKCLLYWLNPMPVFHGANVLTYAFGVVLTLAWSRSCTTGAGCSWDKNAAFFPLLLTGCGAACCSVPHPTDSVSLRKGLISWGFQMQFPT